MGKIGSRTWLLMFIVSVLLFGTNGIVSNGISLQSSQIVLLRTLIGSVVLIVIFLLMGNRFEFMKHRRSFFFIVVSGVSMGLSWLCLFEAYDKIGVGLATIEYYCGPIIVMALSSVIFKEKFTAVKIIGFITVFIGMLIVTLYGADISNDSAGIMLGILSAVLMATMVISNKLATEITGMENPVLQLTVAFITVFIGSLFGNSVSFEIMPNDVLPIIVLGLINTAFGCFLYFMALPHLKSQSVAVLGYLEPLVAVILSILVLSESAGLLDAVGIIMVFVGSIICEFYGNNPEERSESI